MKTVTYEFQVPDFCPEHCKEFSPFGRKVPTERGSGLVCIHAELCEILWRRLKDLAKEERE